MRTPVRVLIIDDSQADADLFVHELETGGYDVTFKRVDSPESLLIALDEAWDVVICDYSMPAFSRVDALRILRSRGLEMPFIYVSGTVNDEAVVEALKHGAQDYLKKDNLSRLLPTVRRELDEMRQKSERRQLESQVQQLRRFEAVGRLAGGIAHDFNNALGIIAGWAQLGYEQSSSDLRAREKFHAILTQAQRAASLTKQLLAFARRQLLQPRDIDFNAVISQSMELLRTAVPENVELHLKLAGDLALVRADPAQIEQVVMNLCLNARDALPHGGRIEIRTQAIAIDEELSKRIPHARPGQFVMLSVCDNGIGMDNDVLERIFEPFFTTKEPGQGTGLGLATVYGIVKQHEGFVNVDSQPHRGTTFRVYLPLVSTVDDTALAEKPVMDSETHETILVAEDSPGLREIAYEVLTSRGYRVILAADGVDAVQKFRAAQDGVDLLLLDVVMPGLSGPNAYKEIIGMKPDVPVVFTTGYGSEPTAGASVPSGGLLLHKPYTPQVLVEAVRSTLNRSRQETT